MNTTPSPEPTAAPDPQPVEAPASPKAQSLTGKDVTDFGKEVGRDTAKQAIVWTLASLATKGFRSVIDAVTKSRTP